MAQFLKAFSLQHQKMSPKTLVAGIGQLVKMLMFL